MDQPGRRSGHSPPTTYQLPPLRSLSSNSGHRLNTTQAQRENTASLDVCQTLRQQIHVLRAEKDRIHSSHEQLKTKSHVMDRELAVLTEEQEKLRKEAVNYQARLKASPRKKSSSSTDPRQMPLSGSRSCLCHRGCRRRASKRHVASTPSEKHGHASG